MTRNDNIHRKEGAEFSGQKFSFYDAADGSLDLLFTTKLQEEAQVGCLRGVFLGEEVGDDVMVTQAPRKDLALTYQCLYRGWEIRSRAVVQTDDNELGGMMVICHVFKFLMGFLSF